MNKVLKLLQKAKSSPQNIRFEELCKLCQYAEMKLMRTSGSHHIYHRKHPTLTLSIQEGMDGKAKPYQVRQLVNFIEDHSLIKE